MMLMRTAKSCGSDAPMLASSLREDAQATVSNKPGHRGEREVSRKPLRAGMPGQSGGPVVTNSCVCFHYTRGCGCIDTRHSPRPRFFQGDRLTHPSGASRRENAEAYPKPVIPAQRLRRCRWRCEPCGALAPLGEPRRISGPGRRPSRRLASRCSSG